MKRSALLFLILVGFCLGINVPSYGKVIELKLATHVPPVSTQVKIWEQWAKKVDEATSGKVKMVIYASESLVSFRDQYSSLMHGICDVIGVMPWDVFEWAIEQVYFMPGLDWTYDNALAIRKQVEKEFPPIAAGRSQVKTLWLGISPFDYLHLNKKEARVPDDIKGLKIYGPPTAHEFIKKCGAVPVQVPPPEWYMAMQTGVIHGLWCGYEPIMALKLSETTTFHLNLPISTTVSAMVMNLDKWNSIPADIQQAIESTLPWAEKINLSAAADLENKIVQSLISSPDHKIVDPTSAEVALWKKKAMDSHQAFIGKLEADGLPAQEAYNKLIEVIARFK